MTLFNLWSVSLTVSTLPFFIKKNYKCITRLKDHSLKACPKPASKYCFYSRLNLRIAVLVAVFKVYAKQACDNGDKIESTAKYRVNSFMLLICSCNHQRKVISIRSPLQIFFDIFFLFVTNTMKKVAGLKILNLFPHKEKEKKREEGINIE